ncbi:hypothetical protein TWF281_004673 [Arthrobotrys megalospora]
MAFTFSFSLPSLPLPPVVPALVPANPPPAVEMKATKVNNKPKPEDSPTYRSTVAYLEADDRAIAMAWNAVAPRRRCPHFELLPAKCWVPLTPPANRVEVHQVPVAPKKQESQAVSGKPVVVQQWFYNKKTAAISALKKMRLRAQAEYDRKEAARERAELLVAKVAKELDDLSAALERNATVVDRAIATARWLAPLAKYVVPFVGYLTMEMLQR